MPGLDCSRGGGGRVSPVLSRVLRFERSWGRPRLMVLSTSLSSSKPSWVTMSLTRSFSSAISKVALERLTPAMRLRNSSVKPAARARSLATRE